MIAGLPTSLQVGAQSSARRHYGDNEYARIYLPRPGWLTPVIMDVGDGDTLLVQQLAGGNPGASSDVAAMPLSEYFDLDSRESVITWTSDEYGTAEGWTLIFQPDYPEVSMTSPGTPMAQVIGSCCETYAAMLNCTS